MRRRDALLGAQERLPQEKQPEVREQQRPRPRVGHAAEYRDVQQRQHRHHDDAPVALAEAPRRVGEPRQQRRRQRPGLHEDFSATSLQKTCPPPCLSPCSYARSCSKHAAAACPGSRLAAVAIGVGLAAFVSQVALTESRALQAALLAAVWRACAVFLVATQVTASTLREIQDKGLELMMSLPLSRTTQYLARLAGFAACGAALAIVFALPAARVAHPGRSAAVGRLARLRGRWSPQRPSSSP